MTTVFLDQNWQEIPAQRSISADTFSQGLIRFSFNVSGLNSVSLKDSYFLIKSSLTNGDGTVNAKANRTTYAHNWTSALFTNASFLISGKEISKCNQYNHLAHTLKMRQMIDDGELKTNYRDMMDYDPDFTRRLNRHAFDGEREDNLEELSNDGSTNIRGGDRARYTMYRPVHLGVFSIDHGHLCGDMAIVLNPNPNFLTACVESAFIDGKDGDDNRKYVGAKPGAAAAVADVSPADYKFQIHEIKFMACMAKVTQPIDSVKTFTIREMSVQNKTYAEQLEFQVLPSTEQITVFIQDQQAGANTVVPATSFKVRQYAPTTEQANAKWVSTYGKQFTADEQGAVQVTLGATTKPSIMMRPQKNMPGEQFQLFRWAMSHQYLEVNKYNNKRIWERFTDWASSPYFAFDFMRDSSDTSGFVTIISNYELSNYTTGTWPGGITPNLFCVSKYTSQIRISYNSGYVTEVQMQNT